MIKGTLPLGALKPPFLVGVYYISVPANSSALAKVRHESAATDIITTQATRLYKKPLHTGDTN